MNVRIFLFCLIALTFSSISAHAGGPLAVTEAGTSAKWDGDFDLHPEAGTCGSLSNVQMRTNIGNQVGLWEAVVGASLNVDIDTSKAISSVDVTENNFNDYFVNAETDPGLTDSINPVVFDDNGEIIDTLFGVDSKMEILGFAGPDGFISNSTVIVDGQAFFNCACFGETNGKANCCVEGTAGPTCTTWVQFSADDVSFTIVHELGHLIGLDHTQVNHDIADVDGACDTSITGDCDMIPTMYPQAVDSEDQGTLHWDDEVALLGLYGTTALANNYCTVTGTLLDADGQELRCADIQALTTDDDTTKTSATVSGYNATYTDVNGNSESDEDGECETGCGDFNLRGLQTGNTYEITVRPIDSAFVSGSKVGPCVTAQNSGIIEEIITSITCSTAGTTTNLGEVTTNSSGGSDGGGNNNPTTTGCSLNQSSVFNYNFIWFIFYLVGIGIIRCKIRTH